MNELEKKIQKDSVLELFRFTSSNISVEMSISSKEIIPQELKSSENMKDILKVSEYFKNFIEMSKSTAFQLFSLDQSTVEAIVGFHNDRNKAKRSNVHDIFVFNINIGYFSFNIHHQYIINTIIIIMKLIDMINLLHSPSIRPLLKPITDNEVSKLGDLNPKEKEALKLLRRSIVEDYFRLHYYMSLIRRYRTSIKLVDVKRRIISRYKQSSLVYQMISGKTFLQVVLQDLKLYGDEAKYLEMRAAVDMNRQAQYEEVMQIKDTDTKMDIYMKNLRPSFQYFARYFFRLRLTTSSSINIKPILIEDNLVHETTMAFKNIELDIENPKDEHRAKIKVQMDSIQIYFDKSDESIHNSGEIRHELLSRMVTVK